ncbi:phosphatases II, partial [Gonapodya prolifera JEL478]
EWRYEMRREMQEIVPGLFLGPHTASKQRDALRSHGITHIVVVRDNTEKHIVKPQFPGEFVYLEINASDHPLENLIPHFHQSTAFIESALAQGGRVLVHCNGGISRSPAVVVGYLMENRKMDFRVAYELVQNKRFCVNPNEGFKTQLKEYEPIYTAREAIRQLNYTPAEMAEHSARRRRAPEEFDDDMEEDLQNMGSRRQRGEPGEGGAGDGDAMLT